MKKFTEWLEEHQDNKCRKCPMYWSDGWYGEQGCYIEEGRFSKFLEKLVGAIQELIQVAACCIKATRQKAAE